MTSLATQTELEELKGTFLSSLNHEIRTPLSGILGMTDLLLETTLNDEQLEYVQAARLCAENLFEILNATLEYSALESGHFVLDASEFSLREVLDAAIAQHALEAQQKNVPIHLWLSPSLPETAVGDAPRLRQLISQLVGNGVKFTHEGKVEVNASVETVRGEEWLLITTTDTGIGIPREKLEAIFQSFQQGQRGLSRGYPGLGLGLALARRLAQTMGGGIGVKSEAGHGSVFTVKLPLHRPQPTELPALHTGADGTSILAVDDNAVGLTILRRALERRYQTVECVTNGMEAVAAAGMKHFDLVLMDLQMPGIDGFEAAARLRDLPGYELVPILALTADTSDQVREHCRAAGMQAYLSKPIDFNELHLAIARSLGKQD
jgi:CheY-like chemotaxis protein/anti-sigma regulatory factor (Ser/Thr protein kinase)